MTSDQVYNEYLRLKGLFNSNKLTIEQFRTELDKLRFQDENGVWWSLRADDGVWQSWNGSIWIP